MSVTVRFTGREKLSERDEPSAISTGPINRQSRRFHPFRSIRSTPKQEQCVRVRSEHGSPGKSFDDSLSFSAVHTNFKSQISNVKLRAPKMGRKPIVPSTLRALRLLVPDPLF